MKIRNTSRYTGRVTVYSRTGFAQYDNTSPSMILKTWSQRGYKKAKSVIKRIRKININGYYGNFGRISAVDEMVCFKIACMGLHNGEFYK